MKKKVVKRTLTVKGLSKGKSTITLPEGVALDIEKFKAEEDRKREDRLCNAMLVFALLSVVAISVVAYALMFSDIFTGSF